MRADIIKAKSLIPGTHRLNLHEIYGDFKGEAVDRDQVEPKHFASWIEWGKENNMKLDFNSTSFSHPKSGNLLWQIPTKAYATSGLSTQSVVVPLPRKWVRRRAILVS